ncbi:hypothetical protein Syun_021293 [Stephania yunnanensis]|uniref:Ribosomal protein S2 n=1 Tax=Stephania yunnanensis TaxID=152371 RepID=A0AAP0IGT4_9MAGN
MMEAGVHFGHGTRKWNPRMTPYISSIRKGLASFGPRVGQGFATGQAVKGIARQLGLHAETTKQEVDSFIREGKKGPERDKCHTLEWQRKAKLGSNKERGKSSLARLKGEERKYARLKGEGRKYARLKGEE